MRPWWIALGVGAFLLVAWPPPRQPLWFDEVFTANLVTFKNDPGQLLSRVLERDAHPPLYYLLMLGQAWITGIWGKAVQGPPEGVETLLRAPSTLLMALAAGAASFINPIGGLLVAASPEALTKAHEARMYPLLALLWTVWLLLLRQRRYSAAAWVGLLALYTHYLAPLLLLPGLAWAIWQGSGWKPWRAWWLYLPWGLFEAMQLLSGRNLSVVRPDPVLTLDTFSRLAGPEAFSWGILLLLLGVAWNRRKEDPAETAWMLIPALGVLLWYLASLAVNVTSARYIGAFVPPLALAVGAAAERLPRSSQIALGIALAVGAATLFIDRPAPALEDYPLMAAVLTHLERPGNPALVLGNENGRLISLRYYYRGPAELRMANEEDLKNPSCRDTFTLIYDWGGYTASNPVIRKLLERPHRWLVNGPVKLAWIQPAESCLERGR